MGREGKKEKRKGNREEWRHENGDRSFPSGKRPRSDARHEETVSENSHNCENAVAPPITIFTHIVYGLLGITMYIHAPVVDYGLLCRIMRQDKRNVRQKFGS